MSVISTASPPASRPTVLKLFLIFSQVGLTSFGGGVARWLMREFVEKTGWLSEDAFINGLAISQSLPGVNVANLSVWIGYSLRGWRGAAAGFAGIIIPPGIFIILLGIVFSVLAHFPLTHPALAGATAAAVGLSLSMGITTVRRVPRQMIPLTILVLTFVAVGILRLPLLWVLLPAGSVGIANEYIKSRRS